MLLAELFHGTSIKVVQDPLASLDTKRQVVTGASQAEYPYDHLILALGNITNYFGIKGLQEYSFGIKSLGEAMHLKRHLHQQLIDERRPDLHYVVVGAGPTGVELAARYRATCVTSPPTHGLHPAHLSVELVEASRSHSAALGRGRLAPSGRPAGTPRRDDPHQQQGAGRDRRDPADPGPPAQDPHCYLDLRRGQQPVLHR